MKAATHSCYLLLGSNLGDKRKKISAAIGEIEARTGNVKKQSSFYVSEPWGFDAPDAFINVVVKVDTLLNPHEILKEINTIETKAGRVRNEGEGYVSRDLDIDILFFDDLIMNSEDLVIPHLQLHRRRFTLEPLHEIAPLLVHPVLKKSVATLLNECTDKHFVKKDDER